MTSSKWSRRGILQALFAAPLFALFHERKNSRSEELVEINGWILKRSDLA